MKAMGKLSPSLFGRLIPLGKGEDLSFCRLGRAGLMKCRHFAANLRFFDCVQGLIVRSDSQPIKTLQTAHGVCLLLYRGWKPLLQEVC